MSKYKLFKDNALAFLIYFSGALISNYTSIPGTYFFPLWIPVSLSLGIVFFHGRSVFPSIVLAAIISHTLFEFLSDSIQYLSLAKPIILVGVETLVLLIFIWFRDKYNWLSITLRKGNEIKNFFLFVFVAALLLSSTYSWFLYNSHNIRFLDLFPACFFITFSSLLIIIPLYISFARKGLYKLFESTKYAIIFIAILLIIGFVFVDGFVLRWVSQSSLLTLYFSVFLLFSYLSIRYTLRVYLFTLGLFSISLLFSVWYFGSYSDLGELVHGIIQAAGFVLVLSVSTMYLKENFEARVQAVNALKDEYSFVDDEISRQVKEYKLLNDQLFEEIEKRGIAERELENSRNLLSEAQQIGSISTWEFTVLNNTFRWISKVDQSLLSENQDDLLTLKKVSAKVHTDDLILVRKIVNDLIKGHRKDFENEIRLLKSDGAYGYFFIRGRSYYDNGRLSRILGLMMDVSERKKADEILHEKEERYQTLFESNIDPICVIDTESSQIIDVNSAFERVYGFSKQEIKGQPFISISAQPNETKSYIEFAKQKGHYRVSQNVHKRKNGDEFFIEANLMAHVVEGKRMLFVVIHDITHRKESENSLAEREQKFRTFFESDLIGMAEVSITKDWINFNDKLCQILGYSHKELKGLSWDQITHRDDLAEEDKLYNQLLTHKKDDYSIEKRFIAKNTRIVYCKVTVRSVKTTLGSIAYFIQLIEDITERKKAEQELIESRTKLSQAQSVAKLGIIRFIFGSNLIILSDEAYEILGFGKKRPQLTRRDLFKSILPDSQTRFEEHVCNIENGDTVEGSHEQAIVTPQGEVKYILTNFGKSSSKQGQISEVVVTLADITRIKQAEMALIEANALKDQIFSIIGHDLRSPVGSMKQLIELYASDWKNYDDESTASILQTLSQTSDETYKLLENLLEWAKSQGTVSFKPQKVDLVLLADQVVSLNRGLADSKGINLQKEFPRKAVSMADPDMIKTVFRNLISNSIKFTPNAGLVLVKIDEVNDDFKISVSDTGKGIPSNIIPKLFDNTQSFTTPGTNDEKGTGLGLKLVKKFVERNGGVLSVESTPGQGTVFYFTLPKLNDID